VEIEYVTNAFHLPFILHLPFNVFLVLFSPSRSHVPRGKTISKPYLVILPSMRQEYKWPEIRTQPSSGIYPFFGEFTQFRDIGVQKEKEIGAIVSVWSETGREGDAPI
jgi:hypothetical protein